MRRKFSQMLTQRQIRFIEEYVACGIGSHSAIAAGYSEKTARSIASELLRKPAVKAELERRRAELRHGTRSHLRKIEEHLAAMAFANWGDLFDAEGRPLRGDELTRETRMAIQAVRRPRKGSAAKVPFVGTPYKFYPKLPAVRLLAQLEGLIPAQPGRPRGSSGKRNRKPAYGATVVSKRGSSR